MMSLTSIPVAFKEVFSTNVRHLHLNPSWTVRQFVEIIGPIIAHIFECNDFDIVEAGQDAPGIPAEAGQPLILSEIRLKNKWGNKLNISFYIRRRNFTYFELQNFNSPLNIEQNILNSNINPIIIQSFANAECPVCFETVPSLTRYSCTHSICNNCYYQCQQVSYDVCPVCRSH
jgi:hypothetical protein